MRIVSLGMQVTLDGFVAGPNGELDWLVFSKDVQKEMARTWASSDTLLFGRRTWEGAVAQGGGSTTPGVKGYVFSRTLTSIAEPGVELIRDDAGTFVHALKLQPGKDMVVMSGGNLARSLFDAGVIDEIGLNVHPVLLGSGVPAFVSGASRTQLELTECRKLDGGCVLLIYKVKL